MGLNSSYAHSAKQCEATITTLCARYWGPKQELKKPSLARGREIGLTLSLLGLRVGRQGDKDVESTARVGSSQRLARSAVGKGQQ